MVDDRSYKSMTKHLNSLIPNLEYHWDPSWGPVLFKLYVNDHDEVHDCAPFQSADDTTLITHCIPSKLDIATAELNNTIEWFSKRTGTSFQKRHFGKARG